MRRANPAFAPPRVTGPVHHLGDFVSDPHANSFDVLILGGYGLVGQAVARRLLRERPRRLILLSLQREEAEEAVVSLSPEAAGVEQTADTGPSVQAVRA